MIYIVFCFGQDTSEFAKFSLTFIIDAINNNTTSRANSILDGESDVKSFSTIAALNLGGGNTADVSVEGTEPGKIVLSFNPARMYANKTDDQKGSLKSAFIALSSFTGSITFTGISLEELE